jgi:hypothetical protein
VLALADQQPRGGLGREVMFGLTWNSLARFVTILEERGNALRRLQREGEASPFVFILNGTRRTLRLDLRG